MVLHCSGETERERGRKSGLLVQALFVKHEWLVQGLCIYLFLYHAKGFMCMWQALVEGIHCVEVCSRSVRCLDVALYSIVTNTFLDGSPSFSPSLTPRFVKQLHVFASITFSSLCIFLTPPPPPPGPFLPPTNSIIQQCKQEHND